MRTLFAVPSKASYAVDIGAEILRAQLSGGPSRFRRDFIGAVATVNVMWNAPPQMFDYLQAFYRTAISQASDPFLIDLVLDGFSLTQYEARFIPGSFRITGVAGLETSVTAQLEVRPQPVNDVVDDGLLLIYENYELGGDTLLETLAELVNVDMPVVL